MPAVPQILLVEDDPGIRAALGLALEDEGYEVLQAPNGRLGLSMANSESPDLVLLDLRLPDLSGFDVCREIRQASNVPIIIVTAQTDTHDLVAGLEAGADDYVTKPFSPREVVARVAAILRRVSRTPPPLPTNAVAHGRLTLDGEGWRAGWNGAEVPLTVTEFAILRVLAEAPRMVFSRDAIIDRVHGPGFAMTDRTIDSHVRNLRAKFEAVGGSDVIETRAGIGYQIGPCTGGAA